MHRLLTISELVEEILSHLDPYKYVDSYSTASLAALAALAQTARLPFHDKALDILWRSQMSLLNTLRCMPSDLWKESLGQKRAMRLLRPIQASDWQRARLYAGRVKDFLSRSYPDDLSYAAVAPILLHRSLGLAPGQIFPNLTSLHWGHDDENFHCIRLFFSPRITRLGIQLRRSETSQLAVLSHIPRECPGLEEAFFDMDPRDPISAENARIICTFVRELRSLKALTDLTISIPDMASLGHIGRLPSLRNLGIRGLPAAISRASHDEEPPFQSLRCLDNLWVSSLSSVAPFLDMCSGCALESFKLTLSCESHIPPASIKPLLEELVHSHHFSLTTLSIYYTECGMPESEEVPGPDDIFTIYSLQPILALSNLVDVEFFPTFGSDFDDAAIGQMAQAWPRLRRLLFQEEEHVAATRTTLLSLQLLACHCPHLESLTMDFSAEVVPPIQDPPVPSYRLRSLTTKKSKILAAHPVARFISASFPSLRTVYSAWNRRAVKDPEEAAFYERWKEVEALIPVIVEIRQEGKQWAQI
ncbi:hypothetical protein FB45DRAFT_894761 [Roridomyces roridus]|uniref:Uncharacterized protein n=1 Tax=Roridomyces roridus TaxID=1738132 RepID=A0AAD7CGG4_9AGAR|nr:hypothetical protein FB45DRAFT_894761 [Roridomyces roridus]